MDTFNCSRRTAVAILAGAPLWAQTMGANRKKTNNAKSPSAETSAKIGAASVTIEYNAPSVRGRKVFGDLVPFGEPWRTGADAATTMTTSADLMIGTTKVPKGTYTLYTLPGATEWMLIVNKQTGQWGTEYEKSQDLARVPMTVTQMPQPVEKFEIKLLSKGGQAGVLEMAWDKTKASVEIRPA